MKSEWISKVCVREILNWLDDIAPFQLSEDFDNTGLLIGSRDAEVQGVLFCLDITDEAIDHARTCGANLMVSHHPIIFHPLKRMDYTSPQGRILQKLVQYNMNVIAAHTDLDRAEGGISDTLAETIGLIRVEKADPYLRIGTLPAPMTVEAFTAHLTQCLQIPVRAMYKNSKNLSRIAVAGGAYGEGYAEAVRHGADAFVVGEIKHHEILDACAGGLAVFDASHYATEWIGIYALYKRYLQAFHGSPSAVLEKERPYRVLTISQEAQ